MTSHEKKTKDKRKNRKQIKKPLSKTQSKKWQCGRCTGVNPSSQWRPRPRAAKKKAFKAAARLQLSQKIHGLPTAEHTPESALGEVSASASASACASASAAATMSASPRMTATATAVSQQQP